MAMEGWIVTAHSFYRAWGKRILDLALAVPALILLSPLMALIALLVRITLGRPVLFRQQRPGLYGRPFTLYKFRTMTDARDAEGKLLPDAQRLTRLGRLLRSSSLDELPELFNVVRGDMSLVGPRPLLMQYLSRYTPEQMRRHEVKPGITGWAQINGRNAIRWPERFALDVWYVDHVSFWLDLKILAITIWKALKREGISYPGHVTMEEFRG
jgi:sugar transferase EpsL